MALEGNISNAGTGSRRLDMRNFCATGDAFDVLTKVSPRLSAVSCELKITVIGSRPYHAWCNRRLGEADDRAIILRAGVLDRYRPARVF